MGAPLEIKELIEKKLFSGESFDDLKENFDFEMAVRLAADTLRLALMTDSRLAIAQQCGALAALGLEIEDMTFVGPKELEQIARALS